MNENPSDAQTHTSPEFPPAMQRAEVLVDIAGQRLGQFAAELGQRLQKFAALAREEGEDIWAEAQNLRQGSPLSATSTNTRSSNNSSNTPSAKEQADSKVEDERLSSEPS